MRLLAERAGLRAGLSAAMTRRGFTPVYDRGQLLVDLAVTQLLGGEAISDFQGLRHLAPVIGPIPSNPTVWRAMAEVGQLELARITAAVTVFRRHWWGLLAARPDGFPWLTVAGRELTEITVVDLDASIVHACSDKENAVPTYKGGIGFCPNLASCDNTAATAPTPSTACFEINALPLPDRRRLGPAASRGYCHNFSSALDPSPGTESNKSRSPHLRRLTSRAMDRTRCIANFGVLFGCGWVTVTEAVGLHHGREEGTQAGRRDR